MIEQRQYQQELVEKVRIRRRRATLIVLPTGGGKTVVMAEIVRLAENQHVLVLVHRRELVFQARAKFKEAGIDVGIILAGEPMNLMARVQIATVQTLWSRCVRGKTDLPLANLIFVDEAHHTRALTYSTILEAYPDARVVGLTATPTRRDGRGLGNVFEEMIEGPQIEELILLGFLVRTKVYAPSTPDLRKVHTRGGDYVEAELAALMDRGELVGDVVSNWFRLNPDRRKTIAYTVSVSHSIHISEEFSKAGVRAAHIDGRTPKDERDEILKRLAKGDLEVVVNCQVLTEGFDLPDVGCIVLARPTKSMGLYRQMVGRGLRPAPGKDHVIIVDHSGATFRHGFVEDEVPWTLDEDTKAAAPAHEARSAASTSLLLACTNCSAIRTAGKPCPQCGFMPRRPGEYLHVRDGDLARLERDGSLRHHEYSAEQRVMFQAMLAHIARERGYRSGWVSHKYKEKFGHWPPTNSVRPIPPSQEVLSWERSRRIAFAKARQKAAANG